MKTLAKKDLVDVLRYWTGHCTVMTPGRKSHDEIVFDEFDEATFTLDYRKPSLPPKSSCLPQSETIFQVDSGTYEPRISEAKVLLFGIRACDMTGILQSKSFMTADTDDVFYRARAENLATVVMACSGPQNETCFCTTTRSGPFSKQGFDLQFYDVGDSFLVEIGSDKGAVLASAKGFAEADDEAARKRVELFRHEAQGRIALLPEVSQAMERLERGGVSEELWDKFGSKCIVCGGCTYVCPTCTCFNVADRHSGNGGGERIRTWDACLYAGFTKEASGHNPRKTQGLRIKRRHEHKLLYYTDRDTHEGLCTCVGCGRCSDYCPVHIGTIEVVKAIAGEQS